MHILSVKTKKKKTACNVSDATDFTICVFERNVRISVLSQEINAKKEWDHGFTIIKKLDAIAARKVFKKSCKKRLKFFKMPYRINL